MSLQTDLPTVAGGPSLMTHSDRCDACGAQAFVKVTVSTGDLLFCGHHYAMNEVGLVPVALKVEDHRQEINGTPNAMASGAI